MIPPLLRRILPKPAANTGSQLRDHQANERTFLSWTRLSLTFAAMALALSRLSVIDHLLQPHLNAEPPQSSPEGRQETAPKRIGTNSNASTGNHEAKSQLRYMNDHMAARICQAVGIWSSAYGIFRYLSVRQNLLQGRFVPATWGPVLVTCSTLGVLGVALRQEASH
jgi:hypothetical protein